MDKYKILIVDNSLKYRLQLEKILLEYNDEFEIYFFEKPKKLTIQTIVKINPSFIFYPADSVTPAVDKLLLKIELKKFKVILTAKKPENGIHVFNYDAFGVLLKPYKPNMVVKYVRKAIRIIETAKPKRPNADLRNRDTIPIATQDKINFIPKVNIMYCKANGPLTTFYLTDGSTIVSENSLGFFTTELGECDFIRTHHSYCVNTKFVNTIIQNKNVFCELNTGERIPVSKRKEKVFFQLFDFIRK